MADIEMPQLGETVTEGTITQWFKQVGDQIAEDEVLFEVSTDKVDSEVPSPVAGYVTEILVPEGETVDVGTRLAIVSSEPAGDGAAAAPAEPAQADEAKAEEPEAPAEEPEEPAGEVPPEAEADPADGASSSQDAAEAAADAAPEPSSGANGSSSGSAAQPSEGILLSPLVRRLVNEEGLNPAEIEGTGAGGRITRADVERHLQRSGGGRNTDAAAKSTRPSRSESDWSEGAQSSASWRADGARRAGCRVCSGQGWWW